ncbi:MULTISPECIES: hypothetical protein [unclassified Bradyrhizobium]|uniref:hypothetical protein n=1 Tax=unclassified Bradyrhizobium TaxID=2631580 RepID=UPI001FF7A5E1|nr:MULTISPECIES: hypothetical protein [unclassified Bradyrhizobium]MCK1714450.1 hypothetical protein [Bradyrhizobium sp. 143]MCK1730376.1 hypothetical protein [Bradyrhizobium sp. 142]
MSRKKERRLLTLMRGSQQQRQRRKLYSFHAPEVEYIRKGKVNRPGFAGGSNS